MFTRTRTSLALALAAALTASLAVAPAAHAADDAYTALTARWQVAMTGGDGYDPADPVLAARIASIDAAAQGWWSALDTSAERAWLWADAPDPEGTSAQKTTSYRRLAEMALAYSTHGSALEGDIGLRDAIASAMVWLNDNAYNETMTPSGNWWDWQIGVPQKLLDVLTLLPGAFTDEQIADLLAPVQRFPSLTNRTGANRVWIAGVIGRAGAILRDDTALDTAVAAVADVLPSVTSGDGFHPDGSFVQHGVFAYTGGYGAALLQDVADILVWLDGTPWALDDTAVGTVSRWVYDGFEPLMHEGLLMDMVRGREISRWYTSDHVRGHTVIAAVAHVARFAQRKDAAAFRAMVKEWVTGDTARDFAAYASIPDILAARAAVADATVHARQAPAAYQQFAAMDRAVQQRPGYAFALSMSSDRIGTHEAINGENRRGWYTGEGMTYLYDDDITQYTDDFWPTVDPYHLPGTTVDTRVRADGAGSGWRDPDREAGGAELGAYGTSALRVDAQDSSLVAQKSWFAFDDEIVALGAGISAGDGRPIHTTVENRKLGTGAEALTIDGAAVDPALGWTADLEGVRSVHLEAPGGSLGYVFPDGADLHAVREQRTGAWSDIDARAGTPTDPITAPYLTLWHDHGVDPADATYAYALVPGRSAVELAAYAAAPDFAVLANTPDVQAVRERSTGSTAAQFWSAGSVGGITSSARSAVVLRESATALSVAVADPSQRNTGTIVIELERAAASVVSADAGVTITQLSPTVRIEVAVAGTRGTTLDVVLAP